MAVADRRTREFRVYFTYPGDPFACSQIVFAKDRDDAAVRLKESEPTVAIKRIEETGKWAAYDKSNRR